MVMRKQKKEYFSDLLSKSNADMKATWREMNSVLKNHKAKSGISQYFVKNGNEIILNRNISRQFENS